MAEPVPHGDHTIAGAGGSVGSPPLGEAPTVVDAAAPPVAPWVPTAGFPHPATRASRRTTATEAPLRRRRIGGTMGPDGTSGCPQFRGGGAVRMPELTSDPPE